ncbi:hypothetical protein DFQ30_001877, partial [Apophysomyces sp. BC1015]
TPFCPATMNISTTADKIRQSSAACFSNIGADTLQSIVEEVKAHNDDDVKTQSPTTELQELRMWATYCGFVDSIYEEKRIQKTTYESDDPSHPK